MILADAAVVCLVLLYGFWVALPHFSPDASPLLASQTPVRTYYDGQGQVLLREPTYDGQWRLDVPLERMSSAVKHVMLGAEDSRFHAHDGVDRLAILRAAWLNLRHGRIKSGASTITMQLVGLVIGRERSFRRKFRQMGMARRLEWVHSKGWILENYLNRIPFGGKLYGIESASRYYFGLSASDINMAEASLLCGLPQAPNRYRPDRHLDGARRRQRLVLSQLVSNGFLASSAAEEIFSREPLRFRDFRHPSPLRSSGYCRTDHFLSLARRESGDSFEVRTSWDPQLQELLLSTLRRQVRGLTGVHDAAGVVVDNASGEVLALVGSLDYGAARGGQVNAATSRRGAGSTLKPFIYAEAIDGGLLCGSTILEDRPLRYGRYSPGNDSGRYLGRVTATEALSLSLNTPVIRLVARLGAPRILGMLHRLGILHSGYVGGEASLAKRYGLSVGLGTCGARLVDLAGGYRLLATGGRDHRVTYLSGGLSRAGVSSDRPVFTAGTCALVSRMLSERSLPGSVLEASWKTGTSTGNRDAWCLAYTLDYTVGIWVGNKDGSGSPCLVGGRAAAPCAGAVLAWLYRDRSVPPLVTEGLLEPVRLCSFSGLRARPGNCQSVSGEKVVGIPLRECDSCLGGQVRSVQVLRPLPARYLAGRDGLAHLQVVARPGDVHWYVDDQYVGRLPASGILKFRVGRHVLRGVSEIEGISPGTVVFEVCPRERSRGRRRLSVR